MNHLHNMFSVHWRSRVLSLLSCLFLTLLPAAALLGGCGGSNADAASDQPRYVRTPHPTFTPTPVNQSFTPSSESTGSESNASAAPEQATPSPTVPPALPPPLPLEAAESPIAVINTDLVNARKGPGTSFTIITILGRGEEFDITGRDAGGQWWRVCCIEGEDAWVVRDFVDTDGAVDAVPVLDENSPPSAQSLGAEAAATPNQPATNAIGQAPAAPAQSTDTPAPPTATSQRQADNAAFEFNLIAKEQFPETNVVRVFLFVYSGGEGLEGYSLRVTKDGVELPVNGASFGGRPGLTWPIADPRQRSQNFKVEFPGQSPAGIWEVQLVKDGSLAGAPVQFALEANDPNRELYVRYERP